MSKTLFYLTFFSGLILYFFVGPRKTVDGDTCTFPFNFRGVTYNDCTNEQAPWPWCAVETFENKTVKDWGYCVSQGRISAF